MRFFFYILIVLFFTKVVHSKNLFDTTFYEIKFISNDIENKKIEKINEIKEKSLLNIFKTTLTNEDYEIISKNISLSLINTFIKNILVNDEKIVNNKYISKIKIIFNKKKIINYLRINDLSYIEYYPQKFLLIIYDDNEFDKNLFSKNNKFYSYLNKQNTKYPFFKIPNLDINDRYILQNTDIINNDFKKIKKFSKKYNINEIIVIHAQDNNDYLNYKIVVYSNGEIFEKNLLYKGKNFDNLFKLIELETFDIWKQLNNIQNKNLNYISCRLSYYNLIELKKIKENLNEISIIDKLIIKSLSYKNIKYDIYFYGNIKILINIMDLNQLKINFEDNCVLRLK